MNTPTLTLAHILWALGIASTFVSWPILGKYSQASGAWINTIVLVGSAIGGIVLAYPNMKGMPLPTTKALILLLVAGLLNGAAVYFYAVKAVDPLIPSVPFIMTVTVLMVMTTPIFGYFLNGDVLSIRQWLGLFSAIIAIFLLAG